MAGGVLMYGGPSPDGDWQKRIPKDGIDSFTYSEAWARAKRKLVIAVRTNEAGEVEVLVSLDGVLVAHVTKPPDAGHVKVEAEV